MAINYAEKFSPRVDEKFTQEALTNATVNQDYDFIGVETVKVFSVDTVAMNDYSLTGSTRYGTAAELQNSVQELKLTKDRSFTFTIDRKSADDTMGAMAAATALSRQLTQVVIPEVDKYRLGVIAAKANSEHIKTGAITKTNAYEAVLDARSALADSLVPSGGLVLHISSEFYKHIKLDPAFVKNSELGQQIVLTGQVGAIDGVPVVLTPKSYLPENVAFILAHPTATVAPIKLAEFKIHENPPGISGFLVEGRFRYDAFVLKNKEKALYVHKTA